MYNYYSVKVTKFKLDIFIQKGQIEEELRTDRGKNKNIKKRIALSPFQICRRANVVSDAFLSDAYL